VDAAGVRVAPLRGRIGSSRISGEAVVNPGEAHFEVGMPEINGDDLKAVLGLAGSEPPESLGLPKPASVSLSIAIDRAKSQLSVTGSVRAPEITVESLRLRELEAPLRMDGTSLTFEPAVFTMYGGTHTGRVTVDLSGLRARWLLASRIAGLNVRDFLADFSGRDQRIEGIAAVASTLRAAVGDPIPRALEGRMQVNVANGVVRGFPLLATINRALRLAEGDGQDTRFEKLSATLVFARTSAAGHVTTDDLVLLAREVRVEAAGRLGFDRSLDLAGQAVVSPERSAAAIRSVRELSSLQNDRGELELPLRITGSMDSPSVAIDLKAAVGRSIKQELRKRIRSLFGRPPGQP
jgi:hypothetical protein